MEGTLQNIALTNIKDHVGTPPSSKLRTSIRRIGVVQPVLLSEHVEETGEIQYVIVDGNRRISAARKSRLKTVPAMVLKNLDRDQIAQLTLILNGYRSANYLTEFWAIRSLFRSNFTFDTIQSLSGFSISSIEHRESLGTLNREIFVALRNGKILQTFASAIAKLPKDDQVELAEMYLKQGRLLKRDIDSISRRSRIPTKGYPASSPAISTGSIIDQTITYVPTIVHSEPITETHVQPEAADLAFEIHPVQAQQHGLKPPVAADPAGASPTLAATNYNGSDQSLNEQRAALHELRGHLISAANIASSFGMDRFGFLAQASRMWDTREQEIQRRLIPQDAPTPVTTTPLAASRASADW